MYYNGEEVITWKWTKTEKTFKKYLDVLIPKTLEIVEKRRQEAAKVLKKVNKKKGSMNLKKKD